ncbi:MULTISPECIES: ABCB family ABC transporter ATP-binding protein/permease [Rhodomicrobium]|uniref:ABCB family ABC transporter ATP-binding protein/permease n=1 Tax=Rhodomicrobium vannielii TaxID=1069 RepID=UPI001483B301
MQRSEPPSASFFGAPERRTGPIAVFKGLLPFIWPQDRPDLKRRVVVAGVILLAAKVITVATPLAYKAAVDWLTGSATGPDAGIGFAGLALVPVMLIFAYGVGRVLMMGFTQIRDVLFTRVGQNAVRNVSNQVFVHLHALSLRFHLERKTGGLSRVVERGRTAVELIIRMGMLNSIPTVVELAMVLGITAYFFGWLFSLIIAVTLVFYIWFSVWASEWRIAIRREMNDSDTEANTKAIDSLLNYETVKYFGNEGWEAGRFNLSMLRYERAAVRTYTSLAVLNTGQTLIYTIGLTICMLLAARGVVNGTHTVGDFVMINAMLIQLYLPLNFLGMIYRELRQGLVDIEAMFELLGQQPEVEDIPGARPLIVSQGHIRFEDVHFSYDPARQILKGVDFEVPAGKMVAIVGPSGAGKSTISRLLFRFYETTSGRVLIDGQDIAEVTQDSLRAALGMVPQDTVLFNDSIEYNIRYGRPSATDEEVREAARMAQIDGFIQMLPGGYGSMVGERGLKLSGGEKQRVAIARTILKSPPILMLDEATSALDSFTENQIQAALQQVSQNRTTLVIAHRLSTIIHADEILVLDAGRIVERGRHDELLQRQGLYAGMWARQREADDIERRARELSGDPLVDRTLTIEPIPAE